MAAARDTSRTFAIEYDISGGDPATFTPILKDDWTYLVDEVEVTANPAYQRHTQPGRIGVGMGLNDNRHPPAGPVVAKDLIEWFRSRATFMGGTPSRWATRTDDARSDPAWAEVCASMDIVQPWTVGR